MPSKMCAGALLNQSNQPKLSPGLLTSSLGCWGRPTRIGAFPAQGGSICLHSSMLAATKPAYIHKCKSEPRPAPAQCLHLRLSRDFGSPACPISVSSPDIADRAGRETEPIGKLQSSTWHIGDTTVPRSYFAPWTICDIAIAGGLVQKGEHDRSIVDHCLSAQPEQIFTL